MNQLVLQDGEKGDRLHQERDEASLSLAKRRDSLRGMQIRYIRNSNPQHFFCQSIPLSFLRVCIMAKSAMIQTSKHGYITALRGYPD
jgi:hypothetical protein